MELRRKVLVGVVAMAMTGVVAPGQELVPEEPPGAAQEGASVPAELPDQEPTLDLTPGQPPEAGPPEVPPAVPHDPRGAQEWLEPPEEEAAARRFALGVGAGMVDTGAGTEPYFTANLRMRFGHRGQQRGALGGYLEPEVGYWKRDAPGVSEQDLLIGVNVGGLVVLRSVSYFVAAGVGLHFIEVDRLGLEEDTTSVGVNVQFGVDVHLSPSISLLGVGRIDLVEKWDHAAQAKAYLGLRVHF